MSKSVSDNLGRPRKLMGVSHAKVKSLIFNACKFDQQRDHARFVGHRLE